MMNKTPNKPTASLYMFSTFMVSYTFLVNTAVFCIAHHYSFNKPEEMITCLMIYRKYYDVIVILC